MKRDEQAVPSSNQLSSNKTQSIEAFGTVHKPLNIDALPQNYNHLSAFVSPANFDVNVIGSQVANGRNLTRIKDNLPQSTLKIDLQRSSQPMDPASINKEKILFVDPGTCELPPNMRFTQKWQLQ